MRVRNCPVKTSRVKMEAMEWREQRKVERRLVKTYGNPSQHMKSPSQPTTSSRTQPKQREAVDDVNQKGLPARGNAYLQVGSLVG